MSRPLLPATLLAASLATPGCFFVEDSESGALGAFCLDPEEVCSCLVLCEGVGPFGLVCVGPTDPDYYDFFKDICYPGGAHGRAPRRPRGVLAYQVPPDAYFALGSYAAGAATSHQVGFGIVPGLLETYAARVSYPPEFVFHGFAGGPVGELAIDLDADGAGDFSVPILGLGGDSAFADVNLDGLPSAGMDPEITHSGSHDFDVVIPHGGDLSGASLMSALPVRLTLTLLPGVLDNPPLPGSFPLQAKLTSVDPESDDADDGAGTDPIVLSADETVEIGSSPCPAAPAAGCNASFAKGTLALKDGAGDKDSLKIKAKQGRTAAGFFGDPTDATSDVTCVYDGAGLRLELPVAAGGSGGNGKPLWKLKKDRASYKDATGTAGGVVRVGQRAGHGAGFDVAAKGASLALPSLPLQAPVTVQHRTLDGGCGEIVFDAFTKNDASQVKAVKK